jgi:hypothetical protein
MAEQDKQQTGGSEAGSSSKSSAQYVVKCPDIADSALLTSTQAAIIPMSLRGLRKQIRWIRSQS